jgi:hypothetical protein
MFHDRSKPFFQSTFDYELHGLPGQDCVSYMKERFQVGGKTIDESEAELIYRLISGNPYYLQKICHILFDEIQDNVDGKDNVHQAFKRLLESEKGYFETTIDSLTPRQRALMKALAMEKTKNIYAQKYAKKHNLGSLGGIQQSLDTLSKNDLITKKNHTWQITDPIAEAWLKEKFFAY